MKKSLGKGLEALFGEESECLKLIKIQLLCRVKKFPLKAQNN